MRRIGPHLGTFTPMREQLPTAEHRLESTVWKDSEWYAHTRELRARMFGAWLDRAPRNGREQARSD